MALQVAGILDELMVNPEWMKKSAIALNKDLEALTVAPGYNVMVTIAGRSYVVASDAQGHLSVTVVPNAADCIARALAKAHSRIIISHNALDDSKFPVDADGWGNAMMANRKLQYTGDITMLDKLEKELVPHVARLRDAVEAQGPGSEQLRAAIEDYNAELKARKLNEMEPYYEPLDLALTDAGQPLLMRCVSWLLFSAGTTMSGNMGQTNYCAANAILDAMTFSMRQTNSDNFEALCLMWGMVVGLGMRWKAFASADVAYSMDTDSVAMDYYEAQLTLRYSILYGITPEWFHASKYDFATAFRESTSHMTGKDPWGFGKGGGLTMHSDLSFRNAKVAAKDTLEPASKSETSWLFAGRRIRLQALEVDPELNGTKGTLVEEVQKDIWHVVVDGYGEKLLRVKNIAPIHTSAAPAEAKVSTLRSDEQMCLAGNWDGWKLHDMQWDPQNQCSTFDVQLSEASSATFAIQRGCAATLKWKPHLSPKKWPMGTVGGSYRIKVYVENSKIGRVDWEPRRA